MGKIWMEHVGKMNIMEQNTGSKCVIEFKPHSIFHKYTRAVREAKRFVIFKFLIYEMLNNPNLKFTPDAYRVLQITRNIQRS